MNVNEVNCKERFNFMLENCLSPITPKSIKEIHQELRAHNFEISKDQVRRDLISQENKNVLCLRGEGKEKKYKLICKSSKFDSTFAQFFYALHLHDLLPEEIKNCPEWLHLLEKIEKDKKKFVQHAKYNSNSANLIVLELQAKIQERMFRKASNDVSFNSNNHCAERTDSSAEISPIRSSNRRAA